MNFVDVAYDCLDKLKRFSELFFWVTLCIGQQNTVGWISGSLIHLRTGGGFQTPHFCSF